MQVQTEIAYVTKHREELLAAMDAEQRRERLDLANKLIEKESLVQLEANLKLQLQLIRTTVAQQQQQQLESPTPPPSAELPVQQPDATTVLTELPTPDADALQQRLEEDGWVFPSK